MKLPGIHQPILSLIAGILILIVPGLLNLIVAIYLIVIGVLGITRGPNRLFPFEMLSMTSRKSY